MADLETMVGRAQEELNKFRDLLASAEVAMVDAEQALEKAKKQVSAVTRTSQVDGETLPVSLVLEQTSEPKSEPEPNADDLEVIEPTEPVQEQNEHEEEEEEEEMTFLWEESMIFERRGEEDDAKLAVTAPSKKKELKVKIRSMEEELEESKERTAHLAEQLAAVAGAKAALEVEMKRLRVQTGQWRKAAEAATALLAAGDGAAMDKHHGAHVRWGWPLMAGELEEDGVVGGRRKAAGVGMLGDLWKKVAQQRHAVPVTRRE
ncbi:hypothetical protein B296_00055213 [Ensete ventricosum]|uniref:Uncharacterized protein n=1 Tax=Ensete ventricosum TaxID=4639 RepID=A0A426XEP2_ENSVE|nr:hypothetical protein B296_00055213 [Ensete ventricosum]